MSGLFQPIPSNLVDTTSNQNILGAKTFTNTAISSGISSGALVIGGGLGVGGNINVGANTSNHNIYGSTNFGNGGTTTQNFYGTVNFASNSANHNLNGNIAFGTSSASHSISGTLGISNTTISSGISSGALVIGGGLGVGGNINAGISSSTHNINGNGIYIGNNTNASIQIGNAGSTSVTIGSTSSTVKVGWASNTVINIGSLGSNITIGDTTAVLTVPCPSAFQKVLTSAGRKSALRSVSTNYTTVATDEFIMVNAATAPVTIALLSAVTAGAGAKITVIKTDSSANAVTITPVTSSGSIAVQYNSPSFVSDGTNWHKF